MPSPSIPHRHRLVTRLLLIGLLPTIGVMLAGFILNATRTYREEVQRIETELGDVVRVVAAELEVELRRTAAIVETLALAQTQGGLFGRREQTVEFLRGVLRANRDLESIFLVYEPNADGNDGSPGEGVPSGALGAEGRFTPAWTRDPSVGDEARLAPAFTTEVPFGFSEAKRRFGADRRANVHFLLSVGGDSAEHVEVVQAILVEGRFVGAVGAVFSLAHLERQLRRMGESVHGQLFLIAPGEGSSNRFVAATAGERLAGRRAAETSYAEIAMESADAGDAVRVARGRDVLAERESLYATIELPSSRWILVARREVDKAFAEAGRLVLLDMLTGITGLAIVVILLFSVIRGFSRRLDLAVASADRIAAGDLAEPIPETSVRDETKHLLDSFRAMSDSLNRIVGQVRQASIRINSTATQLAATARQQEETVAGFSASTTEVAAATREISNTGEELLHTMGAISTSAAGAAEKAEESRSSLGSMQDAMRRLDDAAGSVAARLATISEKAQGINAIVGTITKVADQTNLLSVNAAIEAEKAGEFGVGFLVVAREIRRLADQTAAATLDIERMVRQMQGAVASGVMEMDRFGETLRSGAAEVGRVGERVEGIITHVEEDVARIAQINEGMQNQAAGVRQIDDAMRQLAVGAQQGAQAAVDFGKAAGDLHESIAGLKTVVAQVRLRE